MKRILCIVTVLVAFLLSSCDFSIQEWFDSKTDAKVEVGYPEGLTDAYINKLITLDGSESIFGPNDEVTFTWTMVKPDGSNSILQSVIENGSSNTRKRKFTPDIEGTYRISLTVLDDDNDSNTVTKSIVVKDKPSGPPSTLAVAEKSSTTIKLSWSAVENASYYSLYRDLSSGGSFSEKVYQGPNLQFINSSLEPGKAYFYMVIAGNPAGYTGRSSSVQGITDLKKPANFQSLSNTLTDCDLSWDSAANATEYIVEGSKSADGGFVELYSGGANSCSLHSLDSGNIYFFKVKAKNTLIEGEFTSTIRVNLKLTLPGQPKNLQKISGTQSSITIGWNSVSTADSYKIYRAQNSEGPYSLIKSNNQGTSFTNTGLSRGTAYHYKVSANSDVIDEGANISLEGPKSSSISITTIPAEPTSIRVSDSTTSSLKVSWNAVNGATGYKIYSSLYSNSSFTEVGTSSGTYHNVTGLNDDTTYYFKVKAYNTTGYSSYSSSANGKTQLKPLVAPTGLALSSITNQSMTLSWTPVSGATSYKIYKSTSSGNSTSYYTSTSSTSKSITGLNSGRTYYFWVTGVRNNVEGLKSSSKSGLTKPTYPSGVSVGSATTSSLRISWNSVAGASGYKVYRSTSSNGSYSYIATTSSTSYTNIGLTAGKKYYYKVQAYNNTGSSSYSSYSYDWTKDAIYTIFASSGSGGSISPNGEISVSQGGSKTFYISPSSGYSISNVTVDGGNKGSISSYTFSNVSSNHTISATFTPITYRITASSGTGGSISPSGNVTVTRGYSKTFSISPSSGYSISKVYVDGYNQGAISSYRFSNVTTNHTISAEFVSIKVDTEAKDVTMYIPSGNPRNDNPTYLNYTLKNNGPATLSSDQYKIDVYLSTNRTITSSDTHVGNNLINLSMYSGRTNSYSATNNGLSYLKIPSNMVEGDYYVGLHLTPMSGSPQEISDSNNWVDGNKITIPLEFVLKNQSSHSIDVLKFRKSGTSSWGPDILSTHTTPGMTRYHNLDLDNNDYFDIWVEDTNYGVYWYVTNRKIGGYSKYTFTISD